MRRISNIVTKNWLLITILLIAAFLRLYRIEEFAMFLADQGRDAIIIKRIVTGEHFPAIGAPTSVGQVYLGPFYYYFIAPWLAIFNFDPAGLAYGAAFASIIFLISIFLITKYFFNTRVAFISLFISSFSFVLIQSSRFSWNPNPLPFFSLLTAYFFISALKTRRLKFYLLFGAFLSFSVQLHYLAVSLALPILILAVADLVKNKKNLLQLTLNYFLSFLSFILFSSPLIIFDLRHNFLNSNNFIKLLNSGSGIGDGRITNIIQTFSDVNKYLFTIDVNYLASAVILFVVFVLLIFHLLNKKQNFSYILVFFIATLVVVAFYPGAKHAHYLGMLYPFYIITISVVMGELFKYNLIEKTLVIFFLAAFLYLNVQKYDFLRSEPNNQIKHASRVADFLDKKIKVDSFSFAVQPDGWHEDSYLYFLELKGKVPADRNKLLTGREMFVVCGSACDIKNTKSWNITMFGDFEIVNVWEVEGVKIYRLIRI